MRDKTRNGLVAVFTAFGLTAGGLNAQENSPDPDWHLGLGGMGASRWGSSASCPRRLRA